nr:putative ALA-interacting subunit 2 isoform X2 [Ipomoea trifida]
MVLLVCIFPSQVPKHMKAPIYIYYQLDNYYQNHRRYVKSRSDQQLLHGLRYNTTGSCKPEDTNNGVPIVPCGLIAWSLFNDTYDFSRGVDELKVNRKNIAWRSDRDHKFGKHVYPFNFQNGSLIGGAKLDPSIPVRLNFDAQQSINYQLNIYNILELCNRNCEKALLYPSPSPSLELIYSENQALGQTKCTIVAKAG